MNDLAKIAYHEAGHAVAAYVVKRAFQHVSIEEDEESLGHVMFRKFSDKFQPEYQEEDRIRPLLEKCIIVGLAGEVAEKKSYNAEIDFQSSMSDFSKAFDYICYLVGTVEEAEAFLNWMIVRTKNIIYLDFNWNAVKVLAEQLIKRKRIGYRLARKIIFDAQQEAVLTG